MFILNARCTRYRTEFEIYPKYWGEMVNILTTADSRRHSRAPQLRPRRMPFPKVSRIVREPGNREQTAPIEIIGHRAALSAESAISVNECLPPLAGELAVLRLWVRTVRRWRSRIV